MIAADLAFAYRQGTTDLGTYQDVFEKGAYALDRLRRHADLLAWRAARAAEGLRPLIVDAGANIGAAAVWFHRAFPDASIVAIEPEVGNFHVLQANAAGRPIDCRRNALTSRPMPVRVTDPGLGQNAFRTAPDDGGATIEGISIPQVFAARPPDTVPFIVKIDIEGAEEEVFSADTAWLAETPLLIIELHDWLLPRRHPSRNFLRTVAGLDRDFVHIGESVYSISNDLAA